jgi:hypothetical protein
MRFSRPLAILSVAAIALLAAGWWLTDAPQPARARPAVATAGLAQVPPSLREALDQLLALHPLASGPLAAPGPMPRVPGLRGGVAPPFPPGVQGATCYAAAGGCSLVPCVEFARGASAAAVSVPVESAVVLDLGITARRVGPTATRVGPQRPAVPPTPRSSCRGHLETPKIVRVSVP